MSEGAVLVFKKDGSYPSGDFEWLKDHFNGK